MKKHFHLFWLFKINTGLNSKQIVFSLAMTSLELKNHKFIPTK